MFFLKLTIVFILAPVFYGLGAFSVKIFAMLISATTGISLLNQKMNSVFGLIELIVGMILMIYGSKYLWREITRDQGIESNVKAEKNE